MRDITRKSTKRKEGGFVLVWALMLMVVLLILGISGIGTSVFESMMSANDALQKQSFFQADGGTNVASQLIEENVNCATGFTPTHSSPDYALIGDNLDLLVNKVDPANPLYANTPPAASPVISDTERDAYFFYNAADPNGTLRPRTNIRLGAVTVPLPGGPMQQGAGYEGKGKGLPGGGAGMDFDVYSQYINVRQSQSVVQIGWQHIVGFEGTCIY
jgi:hypothetical protein